MVVRGCGFSLPTNVQKMSSTPNQVIHDNQDVYTTTLQLIRTIHGIRWDNRPYVTLRTFRSRLFIYEKDENFVSEIIIIKIFVLKNFFLSALMSTQLRST